MKLALDDKKSKSPKYPFLVLEVELAAGPNIITSLGDIIEVMLGEGAGGSAGDLAELSSLGVSKLRWRTASSGLSLEDVDVEIFDEWDDF